MYTSNNFPFSFRDPQEAAKREKKRQSVIACRNRKAQADAAAAAKAVKEKEESEIKHASAGITIVRNAPTMYLWAKDRPNSSIQYCYVDVYD